MDGFLGSKQFRVAALVAGLLVVGAAATYAYAPDLAQLDLTDTRGCDAPPALGTALPATPKDETASGGRARTVAYALDAAGLRAGLLRACARVGGVHVARAAGGSASVVFTITGDPTAVARTVVDARFADHGGSLDVAAWEAVVGRAGAILRGDRTADVEITIELPEAGAWNVDATTDVGDVAVGALLVGNVTLYADVGDAKLEGADLIGDLTARTDVGSVVAHPASLQGGRLRLTADTGDISARLPARADVGYDATGRADVGDVTLQLGDVELNDHSSDGASQTAHQRTKDYATKPTKVVVDASTDVGQIRVEAA